MLALVLPYLEDKQPEVVYVDNVAVFQKFNLSKDLNTLHQKELNIQKNKVDSLVKLLQVQPEETPNEQLQRQFVFENNKLQEMGQYFSKDVSQQVWTRINAYMKQYGDLNNYTIIIGTQGNGTIMYGKDKHNITEEFIVFANNKYEGKQ